MSKAECLRSRRIIRSVRIRLPTRICRHPMLSPECALTAATDLVTLGLYEKYISCGASKSAGIVAGRDSKQILGLKGRFANWNAVNVRC